MTKRKHLYTAAATYVRRMLAQLSPEERHAENLARTTDCPRCCSPEGIPCRNEVRFRRAHVDRVKVATRKERLAVWAETKQQLAMEDACSDL